MKKYQAVAFWAGVSGDFAGGTELQPPLRLAVPAEEVRDSGRKG